MYGCCGQKPALRAFSGAAGQGPSFGLQAGEGHDIRHVALARIDWKAYDIRVILLTVL